MSGEKTFKKTFEKWLTVNNCFAIVRLHTVTQTTKMRTKVLLGLAVLAAGVATSMAQSNVYSLNIVGYVTYTNPVGYRIVANPLNTTNNDVSNLFKSPPALLTIFKRNSAGTGYDSSTFDPDIPGWSAPLAVDPGTGIWIANPGPGSYVNTFVGEVVLDSTNAVPAGYSLKSSVIPQAGGIETVLLYPRGNLDTIFFFNGAGYDSSTYDPDVPGWAPSEPNVAVGQGFWIFNNGTAKNWVRHFTVGP
jgi:hypothetical protein